MILDAIPAAASRLGQDVDSMFLWLLAFAAVLTAIMGFLIVRYLVHFHAGTRDSRAHRERRNLVLDIGWTGAAILVAFVLFGWSAQLYVERDRPPQDALQITAIGKQWMWKMQHPGGQREINALHIPVGRPIVVELASQDVIHSFFVPAFRIKQDAVPGRATRLWFEASKTGRYHLFCAEYCGTEHSGMRGEIVAMEPEAYATWLDEQPEGETLSARGERLFTALGCSGCHTPGGRVKAPVLTGLYMRPVGLSSGEVVVADRQYIWDSIMLPKSQVVAGFEPIMPSYGGLLEETEVMALVAYVQSLSGDEQR